MESEEICYAIKLNVEIYRIDNFITDYNKLACTISTNNLKKIVDNHFSLTNQKKPFLISEFKVYGIIIFPSDFISDSDFLIGEIKNM